MIDIYVSRTKTRDKIIAITIKSSKKATLKSVEINGIYKYIYIYIKQYKMICRRALRICLNNLMRKKYPKIDYDS